MDNITLLQKLEELSTKKRSSDFKTEQEVIAWANKIEPLLRRVEYGLFLQFAANAHKLTLNLTHDLKESSFKIMINQMEKAIEELKVRVEEENNLKDEYYFSPNSQLEIQKTIARIISQSQEKLWICDAYMDEKIIEELTNVTAKEVILLTNTVRGLFQQRLNAAKQQFGDTKKIDVRISNEIHDRFYIIDEGLQIWSFGTSYNNAGGKPTTLRKIKNEDQKKKILDDFNIFLKCAEIFYVT